MKSIAISEQGHREVKALCKILGLPIGEFVEYSTRYFKKTGIDPGKSDSESPHKVIKELERRMGQAIAYFKTHETERLNPLLENLIILSRQIEDLIEKASPEESIKRVTDKIHELLEKEEKHHVEQLKKWQEYHNRVIDKLQKDYEKTHSEIISKMDKMTATLQETNKTIHDKLNKKLF